MVFRVWSADGKRVVEVIRETVRPVALFDDLVSSVPSPRPACDEGTADALPSPSVAVPNPLKGAA